MKQKEEPLPAIQIIDFILREYKKDTFDENLWRMKWEDFNHPNTNESGSEYLERMKDHMPLNPKLQSGSPVIIVLEPLYGPVK